VSDVGTTLGGTEITEAEKFWWSWQMRQSVQLRRLLFTLLSEAGSEKEELVMALFAAMRLPCVCAASIVVPKTMKPSNSSESARENKPLFLINFEFPSLVTFLQVMLES